MALGRFDEAIDHMERAERLDPLSAAVQSGFGRVLYRARRFDEAIVHLNEAIELEPQTPGSYHRLADVYEEMGRYDEALDLHGKEDTLLGRPAGASPAVARIYARMGKPTEARRILRAQRSEQVAVVRIGDGLRGSWRQGRSLSIAGQDVRGTRRAQLRQDRSPFRQPARGSSMAGPAAPHELSAGRGQDRVHGRSRRRNRRARSNGYAAGLRRSSAARRLATVSGSSLALDASTGGCLAGSRAEPSAPVLSTGDHVDGVVVWARLQARPKESSS